MDPRGREGTFTSVRARLAAGADTQVAGLLAGTIYAARTPCHDRLVQVTEAELERTVSPGR